MPIVDGVLADSGVKLSRYFVKLAERRTKAMCRLLLPTPASHCFAAILHDDTAWARDMQVLFLTC